MGVGIGLRGLGWTYANEGSVTARFVVAKGIGVEGESEGFARKLYGIIGMYC